MQTTLALWQSLLLLAGWSFIQAFVLTFLARAILPKARAGWLSFVLAWGAGCVITWMRLKPHIVGDAPDMVMAVSGRDAPDYTLWNYLRLTQLHYGLSLFYGVELSVMLVIAVGTTWLMRRRKDKGDL